VRASTLVVDPGTIAYKVRERNIVSAGISLYSSAAAVLASPGTQIEIGAAGA
jgi:hypothetical protein